MSKKHSKQLLGVMVSMRDVEAREIGASLQIHRYQTLPMFHGTL